jgi:hypothetical protein
MNVKSRHRQYFLGCELKELKETCLSHCENCVKGTNKGNDLREQKSEEQIKIQHI